VKSGRELSTALGLVDVFNYQRMAIPRLHIIVGGHLEPLCDVVQP